MWPCRNANIPPHQADQHNLLVVYKGVTRFMCSSLNKPGCSFTAFLTERWDSCIHENEQI